MAAFAAAVTAFLLPGFTAAATGPFGGQALRGRFPGTARPGLVYLPPSFSTATRYPVVYLLHGMPGSPTEYVDGAGLVSFADEAVAARLVRPFIAVAPAAGMDGHYTGEWAGPWERALVDDVVPWVDRRLPTDPEPSSRVLAGLSAGGYGAVDIGLRNPGLFGTVESWSGYFTPLHDGPFAHAQKATLDANEPTLLATENAHELRRAGQRYFLSTGQAHSHWFRPSATLAFAHELRALRIPVALRVFDGAKGEWHDQLAAGLTWAFGTRPSPS